MISPKERTSVGYRSKFSVPNRQVGTASVGTLIPLHWRYLMPNSDYSVKHSISVTMPPLASDTFIDVDYKIEAFFVPLRLLSGNFEPFCTRAPLVSDSASTPGGVTEYTLPFVHIELDASDITDANLPRIDKAFGPGSIFDYLGYQFYYRKGVAGGEVGIGVNKNIDFFPLACYYRCIDDWYRNTMVERPYFVREAVPSSRAFASIPFVVSSGGKISSYLPTSSSQDLRFEYYPIGSGSSAPAEFYNGVEFGELVQRNYGWDYFTAAYPNSQLGTTLTFGAGTTIASLRALNSQQQFNERNQLAGNRYVDFNRVNYGANLSDSVAQRAVLLASASIPIMVNGVYQSNNPAEAPLDSQNPFNSVGAKAGSAFTSGRSVSFKFHSNEWGIVMIFGSLAPRPFYSQGIDRHGTIFSTDSNENLLLKMPNPVLQGMGYQPVYQSELTGTTQDFSGAPNDSVFGYNERFAEMMYARSFVHGLFKANKSLDSFVSQRFFDATPDAADTLAISSDFLKIRTTDLDNITTVSSYLSDYGYMYDSYLDASVVQPLASESVPSLENIHGKSIKYQVGGSRIL